MIGRDNKSINVHKPSRNVEKDVNNASMLCGKLWDLWKSTHTFFEVFWANYGF